MGEAGGTVAIAVLLAEIRSDREALQQSERWHQELLERMAIAVDGMRPAVLRRETTHALAPVLGFRHFFRHAYAVAFDARRLALVADDVQRAHALLAQDLDAFERTLAAAAAG